MQHADLSISNLTYSASDIEATVITYVDEIGVF
jgi:hypothetical protein